ncbi:diguanylate cyclase [Thermocrinis minervae]|uniref:diguanylate cyclase n=1 Tax=Thermocrinis minervae TaxID=381751 RepID=A0A1M6S726_9AQUI|nr:diguanylate cyclase [Thermocrinis minervae]SHK40604.1 PAS domain S-box-containing protein/diguanylate cyclase (GGDEF) domain-containing protein [Thermocrinis minervae]
MNLLGITVKEIIRGEEPQVREDVPLKEAFSVMREKGRGYVLLTRDGRPAGILTERDLVRLINSGVDLRKPAYLYGNKELITCRADRSLWHALYLMLENSIRRLAVVDYENKFLGVITVEDILKVLEDDVFDRDLKVRDIICKRKFTYVNRNTSIKECLRIMDEKNIGALPILENMIPVGIITESDILKNFDDMDLSDSVEKYMSKPVITVEEDKKVYEALKIMEKQKIRRLVVVDNTGKVTGLIAVTDVLRAIGGDFKDFIQKLKHVKDILDIFPEVVLELVDRSFQEQIVIWQNKKAKEILGNLLDKDIKEIFPEIQWIQFYTQLIKEGKIERYKFYVNSSVYEVSASYLPVENKLYTNGKINLLIRDITKEEEQLKSTLRIIENYRRIINSTEDLMIIYEASTGRIKLFNMATLKTLAYTEEELKKMTIFDIIQDDHSIIRNNIERIVREDVVIRGERHYKRAYGDVITVEVVATKVELESTPHILVVARDIRERKKMEEELQESYRRLRLLYDFTLALNVCTSEGEAYNLLAKTLVEKLGVDSLTVYMINPSLNRISGIIHYGQDMQECMETDIDQCKVVLSTQPLVYTPDGLIDCPFSKVPREFSYMCIPVVSSGRIIAVLSMFSKSKDYFGGIVKELIESLVNTFSPFISNLRLIEITRELSIRDPLTNVYNRRFLMEVFEKELERSRREKRQLSVVIFDLDDFKKLNDTHGHIIGDTALKHVTTLVSNSIRAMDLLGRYGGEEFMIILPSTTKEDAVKISERIRKALKTNPLDIGDNRIFISASFGVATFPEDGESVEELLKKADERLYKAKREGKSKVVYR